MLATKLFGRRRHRCHGPIVTNVTSTTMNSGESPDEMRALANAIGSHTYEKTLLLFMMMMKKKKKEEEGFISSLKGSKEE